jgi:hypothetical protein
MNTYIEEMATAFGWSKSDYAENHLLDYYRALVNSEKDKRNEASLAIAKSSIATFILQDFVRLHNRAEKYMDQGTTFAIINAEPENRKIYADFKTLALEANRKRARFEDDLTFAKYFREFTSHLLISPYIKAQ